MLGKGDFEGAIKKLEKSIRLDPNHAASWVSLGVALQQSGETESAFEHFHKAHSLDKDNLMALNNLAAICVTRKQWPQAETFLQRAIQLDSNYAKAHHNLGVVFAKQTKWHDATQSLLRAISISPADPQLHIDVAEIYRSQKRIANAVDHFRRALKLKPASYRIANKLAWILATNEDESVRNGTEALGIAQRCAARTQYKNPSVFNTLAAAHAECGEFPEAICWQQKALGAAPSNLRQAYEDRLHLYQRQEPIRTSF